MESIAQSTHCPLCSKSSKNFVANYPGNFFDCKKLYQCKTCNLVFVSKLPNNDELDKYYSNGLYYDFDSNPFNKDIIEFSYNLALTRLNLIQKKTYILLDKCKTLDIGAGNGEFGSALKFKCKNATYNIVEPDFKVREKYDSNVVKKYSDVLYVEEKDYDLIVLNQIIEHLSDPISFIKSIFELLKEGGIIYIDVPYEDFKFKSSVVPHILFWSPKSLSYLLKKTGFKLIFCDTVGMKHEKAKRYFKNKNIFEKIIDPWLYANKLNTICELIGLSKPFKVIKQFNAETYGGKRMWLRCIAQKTI